MYCARVCFTGSYGVSNWGTAAQIMNTRMMMAPIITTGLPKKDFDENAGIH